MNNGYKPRVIEPEQDDSVKVTNEPPDETLTARALEGIRGTEKLSGLGRFASKVQAFFQSSGASQSRASSHLRAAPVMMAAGVLLLLATALLFVFSKPESAVPSHFRQQSGLSGTEDKKRATGTSTSSAVSENQLDGSDGITDPKKTSRATKTGSQAREGTSRWRSSFANDGDGSNAGTPPTQSATSELQTPATVFVASSIANPYRNALTGPPDSHPSGPQLPSGTEIMAHTTNAISSGLESPVIAVVDRSVELGDEVIIPQGSRIVGYTAGAIKDRINVKFTSLLLPNQQEIAISGLALMKDGSAGLVGKVQGSGHPVLASAGRVATGAGALAVEFAGQNSGGLNQPFSQSDYLRNQLAAEVASEGSRASNRLQQTTNVPIVTVDTNQSIRIFLLNALSISYGRVRNSKPAQQTESPAVTAEQNLPPEQALAAAQTAYIQALEAQLADMRVALDGRKSNGHQ
jgi:hypothetical protein